MRIKGVLQLSLIDYPGELCSVIFVSGCNFRCPYCQNPDLVVDSKELPEVPEEEVLSFLASRKGKIDGVCITGGEPTIYKGLPEFCSRIRSLGLLVKVDTNGSEPGMLQKLIDKNLVDFVAMDLKAPLARYQEAAGVDADTDRILESIGILRSSSIKHEFRVTAVPGIVDRDNIIEIAKLVPGSSFAIQHFVNRKTLDPKYQLVEPYSEPELKGLKSAVSDIVRCEVRGL
jgi:pyruvate formate lyase activating enzyme